MESDEEVVKENFLELIRTLLKDPGKKHDFFTVRQLLCRELISVFLALFSFKLGFVL